MTTLVVPEWPKNKKLYPSLGSQVWSWMREYLVYGPGDLRGQPLRDDDEFKRWLYWFYLVNPKGDAREGKRCFNRCAVSVAKGLAKTEKAAWITCAELHPDAPVRFDGWDSRGDPVGVGVIDPYIPMVAYTEDQTEELAYGALKFILENSGVAEDFDIGLKRIMRLDGRGKAEAIATTPDASDGARTTFQHFDETHRLVLPRHVETHQTMLANMVKRPLADPWTLETTTAFTPGEGSVAEGTMDYANKVKAGKMAARLFFFHRQASDTHDLDTVEGMTAAVIEARGVQAASWSDIEGIVNLALDPQTDRSYWERVWLNRPRQAAEQAFDLGVWDALTRRNVEVAKDELVVLGFDGSRTRDATALVGTVVESGYQWLIAAWERPDDQAVWEVPADEVYDAVADAFTQWDVWKLYADPPYWESSVNEWAGMYGTEHVVEWWTNSDKKMALAIRSFTNAMAAGECLNDGNPRFKAHMGNARRKATRIFDESQRMLHSIRKERPNSPMKIDIAMAATLAWEARGDCVAAGSPRGRRQRSRVPVAF